MNWSRVALLFALLLRQDESMKVRLPGLILGKGSNQMPYFDSIDQKWPGNRMTLNSSTWLRLVLNYAIRARWSYITFFYSNSTDFPINLAPAIYSYFNSDGIFVAIHSTSRPLLPDSVLHVGHKLGIVYFFDVPDEDFLYKASELQLFDSYRSWLIIKSEAYTLKNRLDEILRSLNIGLNSDMVIATIERKGTSPTPTLTTMSSQTAAELRESQRQKRELLGDANLVAHLAQVYKSAKTENETIEIGLGFWDVPNGLFNVKETVVEEWRWNLGGYKILVGVKNSSLNTPTGQVMSNGFTRDRENDEEKNFMELFSCIIYRINASFELVKFQKLGWKNEEGGWTHLLGGVVDETVDFALETIDTNLDRSEDMSFTYAIVTTMNNIYFHRPAPSGMRDIFLAAFSPTLVLCVLFTSCLLAIAMVSVTVCNDRTRKESNLKRVGNGKQGQHAPWPQFQEKKKWKISDAVLWSVSVLCMQGSQWSPKTISENLLIINGLLFALIIYNSFAAFITSVLSVKDVKIKDLKDLADSDFAFGYILGNADELFLRTVNNTLLRELYFKGLRENDGVTDPVVGMHRASAGAYAFFVAARTARRALRTVVAHEKRCKFQELHLFMTKNYASIPMTKTSSIKKIINLKIIRLIETGILRRFQGRILLSMPRCTEKTSFKSARLTDVYSAFFVLGVGWIASFAMLIIEIIWWKRKKLQKRKQARNCRTEGFKETERFFINNSKNF